MDCEFNEESAYATMNGSVAATPLIRRPRKLQKKWTTEEDLIMVDMIGERDAIWNNSSAEYRDRDIKNKCWKEIAEKTKHSVMDAKNHWNTVKSRFNLERKKVLIGHCGTKYSSKFELYKPLQFLLKVEARPSRRTTQNLDIEIKSQDFEHSSSSLASPSISDCDDGCNVPKRKSFTPPALPENLQRAAMVNDVPGLTKGQEEVARAKRWKNVFSEYIFCELERYEDHDAQDLKNAILNVCINFQPRRFMVMESQCNEDTKFPL